MTTPSTQTRPRPSRLDGFKPLILSLANWASLRRDDHPLGAMLDVGWE